MNKSSGIQNIYIVGPTASGKTALSIELALALGGEIVCADSQTLRRCMDIGTAKPSPSERAGVQHHMLDLIEPYDPYSLYSYLDEARRVLREIKSRGKIAIIVGGTGLYIDGLAFNYKLPSINTDVDYSSKSIDELQGLIINQGLTLPINVNNPRHLVNTLLRAGNSGSAESKLTRDSIMIGIDPGREVIIQRINDRVDNMFDQGFIEEVKEIIDSYGLPPSDFDAIGYRIVMRIIGGEITQDEAKELFKVADRQYARRQMAWFRRNKYIRWYQSPSEAKDYILSICKLED